MAGVKIGLRDVVYAILSDDGEQTPGIATYEAVKPLKGAISANFSPNASNDTLFADDGPYDTASTLGAMTLELNVADLTNAIYAELIGAKIDEATGVVVNSSEDIPPYVAVGMKVKKSNGHDRYIWYLKGKFAAPDEANQTKAESINWNTPTITGNFLKRSADDNWRFAVDTDDAVSPAILADFFNSPNVVTGVPAVTNTIAVKTYSFSKAAAADVVITATSSEVGNAVANARANGVNIGIANLTVAGLVLTIDKTYFTAKTNGNYIVSVEFVQGAPVDVVVTVTD